jgi:hypothetical protein
MKAESVVVFAFWLTGSLAFQPIKPSLGSLMTLQSTLAKKRKLKLSESETTAQQEAVDRVWRFDDKAVDILGDVRWKVSKSCGCEKDP